MVVVVGLARRRRVARSARSNGPTRLRRRRRGGRDDDETESSRRRDVVGVGIVSLRGPSERDYRETCTLEWRELADSLARNDSWQTWRVPVIPPRGRRKGTLRAMRQSGRRDFARRPRDAARTRFLWRHFFENGYPVTTIFLCSYPYIAILITEKNKTTDRTKEYHRNIIVIDSVFWDIAESKKRA